VNECQAPRLPRATAPGRLLWHRRREDVRFPRALLRRTWEPLLDLLYRARITVEPLFPSTDHRVLEFGVGLTDLAKKVAASGDRGLRAHYDVDTFVEKMARYKPSWVAFHGKEAGKVVSRALGHGGAVVLGEQQWSVAKAHAYVLPSASGSNRDRSRLEGKADRVEWFKELARLLPPTPS
jgi:G:T/U-mismatch repair DNA glycosylase